MLLPQDLQDTAYQPLRGKTEISKRKREGLKHPTHLFNKEKPSSALEM